MPQKSFPRSPDVQSNWLEAVSYSGGTLTLEIWSAESDSIEEVRMPFRAGSQDGAVLIGMDLYRRGLAVAPICLRNLESFLRELN